MGLFWIFGLLIATTRAASLNISSSHSNFYFLTHTFSDLSCDPYTNETSNSLALECSVQGPRVTPTSSFKIVWHRTLKNTNTTQNLNNLYTNQSELVEIDEQKMAVSTFSEIVIVRSVLTVANLNTNNVSGEYWCTVEEQDQIKVLMYENASVPPLILHPSSVYQGLEACPEGVIHTAMANKTIGPSSSSPSSHSLSTSTIENTSNKYEQSVNDSYKQDMTRIVIFSVTIGMLVFAVHMLLVIVGCLCCGGERRGSKEKKETFPFYRSAISLVSSSNLIESDHKISPTLSSPIPPFTALTQITDSGPSSPPGIIFTKQFNYPPPQIKPPPPKMKPPPLPLWSTLPPQLMNQLFIPSTDTDHFQDKDIYRKRAATVSSEMSYCYAYQKKPKIILFSDIARMRVGRTKQDQLLISPLSSKATDDIYATPTYMSQGRSTFERNTTSTASSWSDTTAIINAGTYMPPDANLASLSFTNKYKSLIIDTMDGCPDYQYPTHARSSGERDVNGDEEAENIRINRNERVKIAVEYTRLNLMNDVMSEGSGMSRVSVIESMDGDYVQPNEVVKTVTTSLNNEELAAVEQPDYIFLS